MSVRSSEPWAAVARPRHHENGGPVESEARCRKGLGE